MMTSTVSRWRCLQPYAGGNRSVYRGQLVATINGAATDTLLNVLDAQRALDIAADTLSSCAAG